MRVGADHSAREEGVIPHAKVGLDEEHGILDALGQDKEPFRQLIPGRELPPQGIKPA